MGVRFFRRAKASRLTAVVPEPKLVLEVAGVTDEADGVIAITLVDPGGDELPAWSPGAHLEIHTPSGLVRQYSLCGDPANSHEYRVSVLREEEGRGGSKELHDTELVGRSITSTAPRNHFELRSSPKHLFIAGGIGVTPILAMVAAMPPDADYTVLYGGRSRASMAFVAELSEHAGARLTLIPHDEAGLIDVEAAIEGLDADTTIYCCGPSPLIAEVERCVAAYAPASPLHFERFAASEGAAAERAALARTDVAFEVELRRSGVTETVGADQRVLDVVLKHQRLFDYSCEEGHCGSCWVKVLDGEVDHRDDDLLTAEERASNTEMYVCVSRAKGPKLVLDV